MDQPSTPGKKEMLNIVRTSVLLKINVNGVRDRIDIMFKAYFGLLDPAPSLVSLSQNLKTPSPR